MFSRKCVIVTAASTGIGRAIAIEFGKVGAIVCLVARRIDELKKTGKEVEKMGGKAEICRADLSDLVSICNLVQLIKTKTDKVDILVNAAGIWHGKNEVYANKDFESFSKEVILDTYFVGLTAPTLLAHAFIPLMPRGSSIINLSGTFEDGGKGWIPYYVSKKAIEDLTIGLSQELKDKGIKVNCVSPSDTATEQYKMFFPKYAKDAQSPEVVAKFFLEISEKDITGKVYVVKKGKAEEGFHK